MDRYLHFVKREFLTIIKDYRYLGTVLITFILTLVLTSILLSFVVSYKTGDLLSSLPVSEKLIKIAAVGDHETIGMLSESRGVYVVRTTEEEGFKMLRDGKVHGVFVVNGNQSKYSGGVSPLSILGEASVREVLEKWAKGGIQKSFTFEGEYGLEDLIKGLLAPILLLSPLFILSLPIIQSISYDRENKMYDVLFATPLDRKGIFLSKFTASIIFAFLMSFVWLAMVWLYGFTFSSFIKVYIVLCSVAFLIISLNTFISTISKGSQEATLGSSIASTLVFTLLFAIIMFKLLPLTSQLAEISPATYISKAYTREAANFPVNQLLSIIIISSTCIVLAMGAFSTEKFAFSLKPGIRQLYEGMEEILRNKYFSSTAMGFVAFSLTSPIQLVLAVFLFFTAGPQFVLFVFALVAVEEILKAIGIQTLKPENWKKGLAYGILIGLCFGISESLLYAPLVESVKFLPQQGPIGICLSFSNSFFLDFFAKLFCLRIFPILVHVFSTALVGLGYGTNKKLFYPALITAIAFHGIYNLFLMPLIYSRLFVV